MSDARQPDFGWSYPPGCNSVPADNEEPEFDPDFDIEFDPSYDTEEENEPPWA